MFRLQDSNVQISWKLMRKHAGLWSEWADQAGPIFHWPCFRGVPTILEPSKGYSAYKNITYIDALEWLVEGFYCTNNWVKILPTLITYSFTLTDFDFTECDVNDG